MRSTLSMSRGTTADAAETHALRADDDFLLAAEHAFEGAQPERQLLELVRAPVRGQPDQVAGAVAHQRQHVVPVRSADDLVELVRRMRAAAPGRRRE